VTRHADRWSTRPALLGVRVSRWRRAQPCKARKAGQSCRPWPRRGAGGHIGTPETAVNRSSAGQRDCNRAQGVACPSRPSRPCPRPRALSPSTPQARSPHHRSKHSTHRRSNHSTHYLLPPSTRTPRHPLRSAPTPNRPPGPNPNVRPAARSASQPHSCNSLLVWLPLRDWLSIGKIGAPRDQLIVALMAYAGLRPGARCAGSTYAAASSACSHPRRDASATSRCSHRSPPVWTCGRSARVSISVRS
jgi:hypothetical protein